MTNCIVCLTAVFLAACSMEVETAGPTVVSRHGSVGAGSLALTQECTVDENPCLAATHECICSYTCTGGATGTIVPGLCWGYRYCEDTCDAQWCHDNTSLGTGCTITAANCEFCDASPSCSSDLCVASVEWSAGRYAYAIDAVVVNTGQLDVKPTAVSAFFNLASAPTTPTDPDQSLSTTWLSPGESIRVRFFVDPTSQGPEPSWVRVEADDDPANNVLSTGDMR